MTVAVPWAILQIDAMSTFLSGTFAGCVLAGPAKTTSSTVGWK
jgi:hypothetical protein